MHLHDLARIERALKASDGDGAIELELRMAAADLAVVANVIALSPSHRIEQGSHAHLRIEARLARLEVLLGVEPAPAWVPERAA